MLKPLSYLRLLVLLVFSFSLLSANAQTERQIQKIKKDYNLSNLSNLQTQLKKRRTTEKATAIRLAKLKNWPLTYEKEGSYAELQKVIDGKPIYFTTFNVDAAISTRANFLHNGGGLGLNLEGQNMTVHVWDGGLARSTHQEYDGAGGNNRFSIGDGTTTLNYHSAHVTGTIIASGVQASAKGMAPQASAVGYEWNNDIAEGTTAASNGMLISNHSYGYIASGIPDQWFGAYGSDARDWDNIMYNAPFYLMVVAAGNDGDDNNSNADPLDGNSSYDKLSGHATAKNNMVVANANDANIDASGNLTSVTINSSSSEGPTDDYRIKPDITGNGTAVYSTYESSDTAYNSITGTSMASPNVAGTLLILQQHYDNINGSFMRAATLKGLALHTADDAGSSGPDVVYGWGLLNAKSAADVISNNGNQSIVSELSLSPGQTYTTTVTSDGINDLMASISWTDPAGTENSGTNSTTPALVNDLDIRVTGSATNFPYRLSSITTNNKGDNTVDPYERVDVANASGSFTITVTHKGTLSSSQNFSLIVTGVASNVACTATTPTGLGVANVSDSSAQVSWNSVAGATYEVQYRVQGSSTWTTTAVSATSTTLSSLSAETAYEVQVSSKCGDGSTSNYSASVNFTTTVLQLNYCASQGNSIADEYIQRVQLNTIDNTSGAASGYTDFTAISTGLTQGTAYTITVTPKWTGTVYDEGYAVWIDYNHDGDFDDSGELVWSKAASKDTSVSGTFTVPATATQTATRMRVSMKYNGVPTSCEAFSYGEVEDYTVNIAGSIADTQAPTAPTNLAASNVTETTVDLSWTASTDNVGVTGYDVYQGATNLGTVTGTSANVTGLTASTAYSFTVYAKDAAGNVSTVSNTVSITTATTPDTQAPTAPSNLAASNITQTTLSLTWNAATDNVGVTAYEVYQDGSNIGSVTGTSTNVSGLTANTSYNFTVYAKDAAGNISTSSNVANATTLANSSGGCTGGVTSYPYAQGFENTLGNWTQASTDDFDWSLGSGSTPSSDTGPSSADEGSYYVYMESSSPNYSTKRAILNSPCFDLSGEAQATMTFKYHMYGASTMGSLALEVSTDNGTSWSSVWSKSGNQGNAWLSASLDLTAYLGGTVQFRFNGITGTTWQGDMAVDGFAISSGTPSTCEATTLSITFDNYPEETSFDIKDSNGTVVFSGGTYGSQADGSTLNIPMCLDAGCYTFTIYDSYGDGICCSYGNGSYTYTKDSDGSVLASGASFTSSEATEFCLNATNGYDYTSYDATAAVVTDVEMYPNPAKDFLTVQLKDQRMETYTITNLMGQRVDAGSLNKSTIDVRQLDAGVYVIEFSSDKKTLSQKFVKQ